MVTCFLHDIVRIQSNTIKNKEKYGAYVLELFLYYILLASILSIVYGHLLKIF